MQAHTVKDTCQCQYRQTLVMVPVSVNADTTLVLVATVAVNADPSLLTVHCQC